jgi:hypothetical protein
MKQKIYILGLVSAIFVFTGTILKVNHLPGASIMLVIGLGSLILWFLPAALIDLGKVGESANRKVLYIVTYITCFVVFTAMLFKIMHWPFAGTMLTIALPFPYVIFLPVFLMITSKEKNFNIYNTVFILFLLAVNSVFSGLLAINISKEKIVESYNISHTYLKQDNLVSAISPESATKGLSDKIDEIIKLTDAYQAILLKSEDKSVIDWQKHPENLARPDAAGMSLYLLNKAGEQGEKLSLEIKLQELAELLKQDSGNSELAAIAPSLFDLQPAGEKDDWGVRTFSDNNLAWSLMYLDGLKSQLMIMKSVCR